MVVSWTVLTAHGTRLCADPAHRALRHDRGNTDAVLAYAAQQRPAWLLLMGRAPFLMEGELQSARALSYLAEPLANGIALRHPGTGRYLSALPDGSFACDREQPAGWETFTLAPDAAPPFPGASLLDGEPTADRLAAYATAPMADPAVTAALVRLLPGPEARRLAGAISASPTYAEVFPALRAHLSPDRERFEWTTTDHLADGIARHGWQIGAHTYGAPEIIDAQHGPLSIGRYGSIGGNVQIVLANHAMTTATTYPFATLASFWPSADPALADHEGKGVVVGHNVWIGAGACLLPGARIGDGAIIGARAVVAGAVPPFAIVAGNPARILRHRFDPLVVARLLRLAWWNWPDHRVDRFLPLMLGADVEAFLDAADAALG